jgi:hypothetical protein
MVGNKLTLGLHTNEKSASYEADSVDLTDDYH